MIVHVFVHPIDNVRFPQVPPGWRWCVSLSADPGDDRGWLNAGWAPSSVEAQLEGDTIGVTVARGLSAAGTRSNHRITALPADPCTTDIVNTA